MRGFKRVIVWSASFLEMSTGWKRCSDNIFHIQLGENAWVWSLGLELKPGLWALLYLGLLTKGGGSKATVPTISNIERLEGIHKAFAANGPKHQRSEAGKEASKRAE